MIKRCLVTGGCGFIGSNLTKKLVSEGWKVEVVDNMSSGKLELLSELSFRVVPSALLYEFENSKVKIKDNEVLVIEGDFADARVLQRIIDKRYDIIFHQAAIPRVLYSVENPSITTDINISDTVRLFEASIGNVDRIVFASSSSVYGGSENMPINEAEAKNPKSPYAWQKCAIEDVSKIFGDLYNLDIVCLRYFNVFGPGQYGDSAYSTAVSAWCHRTKEGIFLRSDGDGSQSRDMCYVDNVVSANILAAISIRDEGFKGRCYNIACGDRTSNNEILDFFKERFSHTVVHNAPWRLGDVMHTKADISRAEKELGYNPEVKFWEGLERTLAWWELCD